MGRQYHMMFKGKDGKVRGCGYNVYGQLCDGTTVSRAGLFEISYLNHDEIMQVVCNYYATFFLMHDGTVKAVGNNQNGQFGLGNVNINGNYFYPIDIPVTNVKYICCPQDSSIFFVLQDRTVKACGFNSYGNLGLGHTSAVYTPTVVPIQNVKQIEGSAYHTWFLMHDGTLKAVGYNQYYCMGLPAQNTYYLDIADVTAVYSHVSNIKQITCGVCGGFILKHDGTLEWTGYNYEYMSSYASIGSCLWLIGNQIPNSGKFINGNVDYIECGYQHTMCIDKDGRAYGVGYSGYGQTGASVGSSYYYFREIVYTDAGLSIGGIDKIICGYNQTYLITKDGTVYSCGYNGHGELGDGTTANRTVFVRMRTYTDADLSSYDITHTYSKIYGDGTQELKKYLKVLFQVGTDIKRYRAVKNVVPALNQNNSLAPYYIISASSQNSATYASYRAFRGSNDDAQSWITQNNVITGWLSVDFGVGNEKKLVRYLIEPRNITSGGDFDTTNKWITSAPKHWTVEGSNNGTDWTVLDERNGEIHWSNDLSVTPSKPEKRIYDISADKQNVYRFYRLNISENNGFATFTGVGRLELYDLTQPIIETVGAVPVTEDMFKTYGMDGLAEITNDIVQQLPELQLLAYDKFLGTPQTEYNIVVTGVPKISYKYRVELANPFTVLKDWTRDISNKSTDIVNDSVIISDKTIQTLNPYGIKVKVIQSDGNTTEKSGTLSLYDTKPFLFTKVIGLSLYSIIGDNESDKIKFLLKLNGVQIYPETLGLKTQLLPTPYYFQYNVKSSQINYGLVNTFTIEVEDQFGKQSVLETNFIGDYAGLMFTDKNNSFYTTDMGALLYYLDFGTIVAGTLSDIKEVYIQNTNGFPIKDTLIKVNTASVPTGVTILLSKTQDPFVPQNTLNYTGQTLQYGDKFPFYVKVATDPLIETGGVGIFEILTKGIPIEVTHDIFPISIPSAS